MPSSEGAASSAGSPHVERRTSRRSSHRRLQSRAPNRPATSPARRTRAAQHVTAKLSFGRRISPATGDERILAANGSGVEEHRVGGVSLPVFNPAKTVADCFNYRNKIGHCFQTESPQYRRAACRHSLARPARKRRKPRLVASALVVNPRVACFRKPRAKVAGTGFELPHGNTGGTALRDQSGAEYRRSLRTE